MLETHLLADETVDSAAALPRTRWRVWELGAGFHCSIIGTCLSLDDLNYLIRKLHLRFAEPLMDFDVHAYFVQQSRTRSAVSKAMQKLLDRKYATAVARWSREATDEGFARLWQEAVVTGVIPGHYWALMTHRDTPGALRNRAHGEIHMLSHLMGASNRQTIRQVKDLEQRCQSLEEELTRARQHAASTLAARDGRIAELEQQLTAARQERLASPATNAARRATLPSRWARQFDHLQRRLKAERARARAAENRLQALSIDPLLARAPQTKPTPTATTGRSAAKPDVTALRGRQVLYVGGRQNLVPHLRALVETHAGNLIHHDGGIEANIAGLDGLVTQADAVFCPVDCVSHGACLRLKHLCRRHGKPFCPLRSASLSTFAAALGFAAHNSSQPTATSLAAD